MLRSSSDTDTRIVQAIERLTQAFRVLLREKAMEFSLSPIQVQVLIFLATHTAEKNTVSHLAKEFDLTKPTVSEVIKTLEEKRLVTKEFLDGRSFLINVTRKGKEISNTTSVFTDALKAPVDRLDIAEKEILLSGLMKIISYLNQTGVITLQRMCFTCSHYRADHNGLKNYCGLLQTALTTAELRIDCPDHQVTV